MFMQPYISSPETVTYVEVSLGAKCMGMSLLRLRLKQLGPDSYKNS
jgi:hypothetical protein